MEAHSYGCEAGESGAQGMKHAVFLLHRCAAFCSAPTPVQSITAILHATPHPVQNNPELDAVWRLLQFSWNRHYQGMWQAMQSYQWGPQLAPLIEALAIKTRQELMELVSLAYATVSPAKVASLCGMTEAEVLNGEAVWGRLGMGMSRPCRGWQPVLEASW